MRRKPQSRSNLEPVISVDGRRASASRARIPVLDWAVRYGWGAFETIRLKDGCPLFLSRHLDRFYQVAAALVLASEDGPDWWHTEVSRLVTRAGFSEGAINLYWTRGNPPDFRGHRVIVVRPHDSPRRRGSRAWIAPWRVEPGTPGIGAKTMAYLPYTFAAFAAQAAGFDDALLLNTESRIADGAAASVFVVRRKELITPPLLEGALPGITREIVMEQADALGIPVRETPLTPQGLYRANGVFLTSVLREIMTVHQVDDRRIKTTPAARQLIDRLRRRCRRAVKTEIKSWREQ